MLPDLLNVSKDDSSVKAWGERFLGIFLIGGTIGGWLFSSLADRWGRKPVMALTILFYSVFSGMTAFATEIWHVGVLRFLVAMGVGANGRSVLRWLPSLSAASSRTGKWNLSCNERRGLWLAAGAGLLVGTNWRWAYLIGIVPALLVLWVRVSVKEPESWEEAKKSKADRMGSFSELLGTPRWRSHAIFGALLAMVGLATFWGVVVAGQDIAADLLKRLRETKQAAENPAVTPTEDEMKAIAKIRIGSSQDCFWLCANHRAGLGCSPSVRWRLTLEESGHSF